MGSTGEWLADQYVAALDMSPVHIIAANERGRPIRISFDWKPRRPQNVEAPRIHSTVWCSSELWAIELETAATAALAAHGHPSEEGWIEATPDDAHNAFRVATAETGVIWKTADAIALAAAEAMARVETEFTRMQAAGELKALNRAYREYRLACNAADIKAMHYTKWIGQKKLKMFRAAVESSRFTTRTF